MINFSGKTALVTGGTRGIGRSIVMLLLDLGCKVIYTGTKETDIDPISGTDYWKLDLSDAASIKQFRKRMQGLGRLDVLVNNAGINIIESIDELDQGHWEKILQVNLTGAMLVMKESARIMKRNNTGGKILNISSVFGIVSKAKRNSYSASKSGLIGLTRASALDLASYNILVNALCPGFTRTELTESILSENEKKILVSEIPLGRFADASEIANIAVFLCSDLNTYMVGQIVIVDGGFTVK